MTGSVVGIGNMTGPAPGGFLVAHFAWPVIFWINIPIGVIAFAWPGATSPNRNTVLVERLRSHRYHLIRFGCGNIGAFPFGQRGIEWRLFLLGMILLLGFYGFERNPRALLDLALFKVKSFLFGNVMGFITYIVQTFMFFLLPFYLERVLGYSPDQSGLFMTIPPICLTITAPLAGSLSDRIGPARLTSISYFLVSIAFIVFSLMDIASSPWHIAAGLVTFGIGMGCFGSPNNSSILGSVPKTKAGYAGGFIATIRNFGNALGIALSASLLTWLLSKNLLSLPYKQAYVLASHHTYLFAAGLSLTGLLISLMTASQRDTTQQRVSRQDA